MDQLARANDQRANAGADQGSAQDHQCCGEATYRQSCGGQPGNPATCHHGGEGCGISCQTTHIIEQPPNGDADRAGAARHRRNGIGHRFQCRSCRDRQLVRYPAPDQPKTRDRIIGPLDLIGVLFGHDNTKIPHIIRCLS